MIDFKFGDVIRLSDDYQRDVPTCYKGRRLMVVAKPIGIHATCVILKLDGRERGIKNESPGDIIHIEVLAWQVDDAGE